MPDTEQLRRNFTFVGDQTEAGRILSAWAVGFGGVAAALVGAKVAKSPKTRELCVAGMAKGMKLQQDARVTLQNMKEDAQDLCAEAKQKAAQETAEEA